MKEVVTGTGDKVKDKANLEAAFQTLGENDTLVLRKDIFWEGNYTAKCNIIRRDGCVDISDSASIVWNPNLVYTKALKPFEPYDDFIKADLNRGDIVMLVSDDAIQDTRTHFPDGKQCPIEMHTIADKVGDKAILEESLRSPFTLNPRYLKIPKQRVRVEGIRGVATSQNDYKSFLIFKGVSVSVQDVIFERNGPGAILLQFCTNSSVKNCTILGTYQDELVYGIVVGACNATLIKDNFISGCRHAFTTTAGGIDGTSRYGVPLNTVVSGNIIKVPTNTLSRIGLDTHCEENGTIFENNVVTGGSHAYGIQTRGKNTIIRNNKAMNIVSYGHNATIIGNICEKIMIKEFTSTLMGNKTKQIEGKAIYNCAEGVWHGIGQPY